MANKPMYRAPKRQIEKVRSLISHTITNANITKACHVAEDRKTLVRSIIQLEINPAADGGYFHIALVRDPRSTQIESLTTGESLDQDQTKEQIWSYQGYTDPALDEMFHPIFVDLSSMRKLDPGDEIVLRTVGSGANTADVCGVVQLFFKE